MVTFFYDGFTRSFTIFMFRFRRRRAGGGVDAVQCCYCLAAFKHAFNPYCEDILLRFFQGCLDSNFGSAVGRHTSCQDIVDLQNVPLFSAHSHIFVCTSFLAIFFVSTNDILIDSYYHVSFWKMQQHCNEWHHTNVSDNSFV
jgi:hypothetical protein